MTAPEDFTLDQILQLVRETHDIPLLRGCLREIFRHPAQLNNFGKFFFPDTIQGSVPDFHREINQILIQESNDALAAPRGHAKSTIVGQVFITWCIVNKIDNYIVYISQNHTKTVQFLEPINFHFKENKMLRLVYGNLTPRASAGEDGRDREDCFDVGGVRVEAVSFEKNLRGFKYLDMRPTLIIMDDIEDDERVMNPVLRLKDEKKMNNVIIPSLDINGRIKFIGTILHHDGLLAKKIKQYGGKIYRAIDEHGNVLWPERFTQEKLDKIKADIGAVSFQQEFLNDPQDNVASIIRRDWIVQCLDEELSSEEARKLGFGISALGVDFAFGDRVTNDKSAFIGVGDYNDKFVVTLISTKRGMSALEQLDYIRDGLQRAHKFTYVGLEENSIKSVSKNIDAWGLPVKLFWTSASDPANRLKPEPDFGAKRYTVGKNNMIHRLASAFQTGKFVIPYKTQEDKMRAQELISECTSYSLQDGKLVEATVHPDIPIALGYALECLEQQQGFSIAW